MSTKYFVGREVEINSLMENLKSSNTDTKIINLYGIGGAGKTTLINKLFEKINDSSLELVTFRIDEDIEYNNIPSFVNSLSKKLKNYNLTDTKINFQLLYNECTNYQKINGEIESIFTNEELKELQKINDERVKQAKKKGKRVFHLPILKIRGVTIESSKYEGAELDGAKASDVLKEHLEFTKKRIIEERYKDPESQKFYLQPMPRITKAFKEGLYESIFAEKGVLIFKKRKNELKKPIKLLFVLDTFEKLSEDINDWLIIYLLPMLDENKDSYDYRILISGREQLILTSENRRWDDFKILEKDIHRFSKEEVKLYLEKRNLNIDELDEAYAATDGLAYLLDLWADNKEKPGALFYGQASDRIFWWVKDEDKREWIRMASFLDGYDQDSLQLFIGDKEIAKEAYEWLSHFHEVTRSSKTAKNKFELHETVKKIISKSVEQQSPDKYHKYLSIVKLQNEVEKWFPDIKEKEKILKLSIFNHFDQSLLNEIYITDAFSLYNYAIENTEQFDKLNHTLKLNDKYREKLNKYVSCKDAKSYKIIREKTENLWKNRKMEIEKEIKNYNNSKASEDKLLFENEKELENINKDIEFIKLQIDSKEIEKKEPYKTSKLEKRNYTVYIILGLLSVIFLIAGYIIGNIVGTLILSFSILAFFLLLFVFFKNISKHTESPENYQTKKSSFEDEIYSMKENLHNKEKRLLNIEKEIDKNKEKINEILKKISDCYSVIKEPYI